MGIVGITVLLLFHHAIASAQERSCQFPKTPKHGSSIAMPHRHVNGTATFYCNEGYWYNGTNPRVCQKDGKWSGIPGLCQEVLCSKPQLPLHGNIDYTELGYNHIATVVCDEGYRYSHPEFNPRLCQGNNTWSFNGGSCEELLCQDLPGTKHGRIVYMGKSLNASAKLECDRGYVFKEIEWTCQSNTTWGVNLDKQCERIRCLTKPVIKNGNTTVIDDNLYGMNVTIKCCQGFALEGKDMMTCQANGQWSKPGICKKLLQLNRPGNGHKFLSLFALLAIPIIVGVGLWKVWPIRNRLQKRVDDESVVPLIETVPTEAVINFSFMRRSDVDVTNRLKEELESEIGQKVKAAIENNINVTCRLVVRCISECKHMVFIRLRGNVTETDIRNALTHDNRNLGIVRETLLFRDKVSTDLAIEVVKSGNIKSTESDRAVNLETGFVEHKVTSHPSLEPTELPHAYQAKLEDKEAGDTIENVLTTDDARKKCVVIHGRAGIGKTTLMQRLMWRWAHGEWATHLKAIFLLNVRVLVAMPDKHELSHILSQCAMYRIPDIDFEMDEKWFRDNEQHIGIFLDGIDEINGFEDKWKSIKAHKIDQVWKSSEPVNLIFLLMKRYCLAASFLIITSRPFKGLSILKPNRTIEVLGLTEDRVKEYIDKNVPNTKKEHIQKTLVQQPILLSLCSITFFCAALCQVLQDDIGMTDKLTTYTQITAYLMEEFVRRSKKVDRGEPVLQKMAKLLKLLCNLAYVGLMKRDIQGVAQLAFHGHELEKQNLHEKDVEEAKHAGLFIQNDAGESVTGEFVHMYILELLAMVWLLTQTEKLKKALGLKTDMEAQPSTAGSLCCGLVSSPIRPGTSQVPMAKSTSSHFQTALLFLYGLAFGRDKSTQTLCQAITGKPDFGPDVQGILREGLANIPDDLQVLQMLHESQSPELAAYVGEHRFHDRVFLKDIKLTAVDMLALTFMLTYHPLAKDIVLSDVGLDSVSIQKLAEFMESNNTITSIKLKDRSIDDSCMEKLSIGLRANKTLRKLVLPWTQLRDTGATALLDALKCNTTVTVMIDEANCSSDIGEQVSNQERIICLDTLHENLPSTQGPNYEG